MSDFIKYYVPEINKYFKEYWWDFGEIEFDHVNIPYVESNDSLFPSNSFLEILFNNSYDGSGDSSGDTSGPGYNYLFKETKMNMLDPPSIRRLRVSGKIVKTYITDSTGTLDLYGFSDSSSDNRIMMDKVLDYRLGNTVDLTGVDYSGMTQNLGKLMYLYLDLMVNGVYTPFESSNIVSEPDSILDNLYELYVLNEAHRLIKQWEEFTLTDTLVIRPVRKRYCITEDSDASNYYSITISDPLPHDTDKVALFYNGDYMEREKYGFTSDSSSFSVFLDSTSAPDFNLKDNDIIVIDYFTNVDVPLAGNETI